MQIFKGSGESMEAALLKETFHPQLNARGVEHILPLITVDLRRRGQAIAAFILINQRADIPLADAVDHLNQIAHRPGIDRKAEFDLGGNFIAIGDRDFTHVVAETADFQMTGILLRNRLAHPGADALMGALILPVAGNHAVLLAHARADKAELAAAVRGLIQVHKVHIDAVPRQRRVVLRVELQQRLIEDSQAVNPHFGRRKGVQPHHHAGTFIIIVSVAADMGNLIRRGAQRL